MARGYLDMDTFIKNLVLVALTLSFSAGLASALQHFSTYRIFAAELISVTVGEQEVEDPASLILKIGPSPQEATELLIESDGSLDECRQSLEAIMDYASGYVEILVDQAAQTMNGVMVLHCTAFDTPFIDLQ